MNNLNTLLKFSFIFVNCIENVSFGIKSKFSSLINIASRVWSDLKLITSWLKQISRKRDGHMIGPLIDHENECFHRIGPFS